jgi:hypothetical protein
MMKNYCEPKKFQIAKIVSRVSLDTHKKWKKKELFCDSSVALERKSREKLFKCHEKMPEI